MTLLLQCTICWGPICRTNIFQGPNLPGPDLPRTKQPKTANIRINFSLVVLAAWKQNEQIQVWNLGEDDIQKRDHKTDCTMLHTKGEPAISRNESLLFPSPNFENRIHFISFPSQFAISHICIWESKANWKIRRKWMWPPFRLKNGRSFYHFQLLHPWSAMRGR